MKKDYMKPAGRLVVMSLQENIAASGVVGGIIGGNEYGITYRQEGDTVYIANSTFVASGTGSAGFDSFYDLVASYVYNLESVCRA